MENHENSSQTPNSPNFACKEYVTNAPGLIGVALEEAEQAFKFVPVEGSEPKLNDDTDTAISYSGLRSIIPLDGGKNTTVETREYADGDESVHVTMDYADPSIRGVLFIEIYEDHSYAIKLLDKKSKEQVEINPGDKSRILMYCSQNLHQAAIGVSQ